MESITVALATSFDVDPQRIDQLATELEIDQFDGVTSVRGVAAFCVGDGSVSPCATPPPPA